MRFLSWRQRHVSENTFIIILSLIIGVLAGVAAFLMKSFIHLVQDFVVGLTDNSVNFWYLGMPMLGIFLAAIFVKYIVKDDISHGIYGLNAGEAAALIKSAELAAATAGSPTQIFTMPKPPRASRREDSGRPVQIQTTVKLNGKVVAQELTPLIDIELSKRYRKY